MRYRDDDGDVWEDVDDAGTLLRCTAARDESYVGRETSREVVEASWGPLTPVLDEDEEARDLPSDRLPLVADVMDRASVFQNAHALVTGLKWDEREWASIHDVLQVAKWMEREG
ncbi:hypothetical protein [Streptomyces canus]|uniref:hypothetical protein n=1 Tax=Streptomyces canus TaxID=58343 RepID=UPI00386945CD|nr:hypothetical protein OH824_34850 [Streptomyces canus]